jgi:hypothetical protein
MKPDETRKESDSFFNDDASIFPIEYYIKFKKYTEPFSIELPNCVKNQLTIFFKVSSMIYHHYLQIILQCKIELLLEIEHINLEGIINYNSTFVA